jgi:TetR/AcrR family transcriptional repressor of nem operon
MSRSIAFVPEEKITSAMNVFWSKGYNASSLADLTQAMQINKSSLYNSFGDKHTLFKTCLSSYGKLVEQDYQNAIKLKAKPIDNLESIIDKIVEISTERDNSCLGIKTSFELAADDKEIRMVIRAGHDQAVNMIQSLVEEAQLQGDIQRDRNANTMAHFIFNSFAGMRQSYIIYNNIERVKLLGEELKIYIRA